MSDKVETKGKQGPVTVLTLLFGLLIGLSGPGAQLQPDPGQARLGNGEIARAVSGVRTAGRQSDDNPDDAKLVLAPPAPQVVTELVSVRPAGTAFAAATASAPSAPHFHYRARAPPAA